MHRRRIRTIKPELFSDEKFIDLSDRAQILFIGLISYADDHGRFMADVRQIAGALRLGRLVIDAGAAIAEVQASMGEIAGAGMLRLYTADGRRYGHLPKWYDHQKVDKPSASEYPDPATAPDDSRAFANVRDDSRDVAKGRAGSGSGSGSGSGPGPDVNPVGGAPAGGSRAPKAKKLDDPRIEEVHAHWLTALNKSGIEASVTTAAGKARVNAVAARLADGYDVAQLKRAVDGCARSDFHREGGHTDLTLIMRAGKVDGFIERASAPQRSGGHQPYLEPGDGARMNERGWGDE